MLVLVSDILFHSTTVANKGQTETAMLYPCIKPRAQYSTTRDSGLIASKEKMMGSMSITFAEETSVQVLFLTWALFH